MHAGSAVSPRGVLKWRLKEAKLTMQRSVSSLRLSSALRHKLTAAGLRFTSDLTPLTAPQLSREAGVCLQDAVEVLQCVRGGGACVCECVCVCVCECVCVSALELLQQQNSVVSFCRALDGALGGGISVGKTTEICGAPGTGKTQLCLQLAVDVQVPRCFGGVGGQAVFIDTEGSFLLRRAADMAAAAVRHCSSLAEDAEQRVAMTTFTVETVLANIFLVRCRDYVELLAELQLLHHFLSEHPGVRLLVIDSVAFPFRRLFDDLSRRTRLLAGLALKLVAMATAHNIAVVTTNHMTTRLQDGQSQLVPALGESWGHAPSVRLLLRWAGPRRVAAILKSPCSRDAAVEFQITTEGFRDADQSEPRTHTHTGQSEPRTHTHTGQSEPRTHTGQSEPRTHTHTGQSEPRTHTHTGQSEPRTHTHTGQSEPRTHTHTGQSAASQSDAGC